MRLVAISDTHGSEPQIPDGDVLVHAGDLTMEGNVRQMGRAINWIGSLPHEHKIVIAGNHDFFAEDSPDVTKKWMADHGITYLHDSGVEIQGLNFWGSPYQPWFHDWAFNKQRGPDIKRYWDMIPDDTDILITHGPPMGKLDLTSTNEYVGCTDLMNAVLRVKPRIHIFGHIHEQYGIQQSMDTYFVNASIMTLRYRPDNCPWKFDIYNKQVFTVV